MKSRSEMGGFFVAVHFDFSQRKTYHMALIGCG